MRRRPARCRSASPERLRPWATGWRSASGSRSPWGWAPVRVRGAGAGAGGGVGIGAAGFTRVCGWAAISASSASERTSSDRPDRLDRSDRRSDIDAASIWAASATLIWSAADVATPSGMRAGPSVTTPAPTTSARPAAERRPTVRQGRERQRTVFGRVTGSAAPRWRPEASRPVDGGGGVTDIANHRTTDSRNCHIQVTASYTRTRPSSAEVRHRVHQRMHPSSREHRDSDGERGDGEPRHGEPRHDGPDRTTHATQEGGLSSRTVSSPTSSRRR